MIIHTILPSKESVNNLLLLDVPTDMVTIPSWIQMKAKNEGYRAKNEYHITVIGTDLSEQITEQGLSNAVQELIAKTQWHVEFAHDYIELAKDDQVGIHRQSIIQLAYVAEMDIFFDQLQAIAETPLSRPPEHVTLFTKNYDKGIGLYSNEDLKKYKIATLTVKD